MSMQGLPVSRLVNVTINLEPQAAARRGFGVLLLGSDNNAINGLERYRSYESLEAVAADFGTTDQAYKAAALYYGQTPRPQDLMIGRWLRTATAGFLQGASLTTAEQLIGVWTTITNGGFTVEIDNVSVPLTGLDFSGETNLNGVAAVIDADLGAAGSCVWTGSRFEIVSATTGAASEVGYATAPGAGVDIGPQLKLTAVTATAIVPGYDAETPVQFAQAMTDVSNAWYGLQFAASTQPTDSQALDVSEYIEGLDVERIYGITETDTRAFDSVYTADIGSVLEPLNRRRTFLQYSGNRNAVASGFGRNFSVNFAANKSVITWMYKQQPGIAPENLTSTQAATLKAKRYNVFAQYNNNTAILQDGIMSGDAYFDEIHGLAWLRDAIQNNVYNLLYTSTTKVPQTEPGMDQIRAAVKQACEEGVNNGLIAAGVWNQDGFGDIKRGDYLERGYYVYSGPIALQSVADRGQRKATPVQVAVKLAGAIHTVDIAVTVNR